MSQRPFLPPLSFGPPVSFNLSQLDTPPCASIYLEPVVDAD
jgi:hypothetical protein